MVISLFHKHRQAAALLMLALAVLATMAAKQFGTGKQSAKAASQSTTAAVKAAAPSTQSSQPTAAVGAKASSTEMRAVWVPYYTLSLSGKSAKDENAFIRYYTEIVQNAKARGMNAVVVHVRAFSDAMYPSQYYPWSNMTGNTQGVNPGYDPLKDMVSITHAAGLQFHAWLNPLRVQLNGSPSILAQNNPWNLFAKDPAKAGWAVSYESGKYLDPGFEGVRRYIAAGAAEIAKKYAVDGIQFDDYFYPEDGGDAFDAVSYKAYCAGKKTGQALSRAEWRCANINDLLSKTYRAVKENRPQAAFGVSPQGNLQNDKKIGADAAVWCRTSGYVDYICPQVYYNYNNPILPYDKAVQTWRSLVTAKGIKLYFGLGLYKADSGADSGAWKDSTNTIARQIETARTQRCDGFMIFSYEDLLVPGRKQEVENVMKLFQ
ncbi:MAG: family 10 glycosylhydrolase [Oscillospiraceae bacterium]|nr:family 10 glycosylhydrolase [Oscillospiraceae bacterium]MDD3262185.1 family 10 glycosylhydrolase [Oscillospiraceae bacterium]